jgi:hypothetical protein
MLHEKLTVVIDNVSNDFNAQYPSWPFRVWIIDQNQRIAFKGMANANSGFDINLSHVQNWLRALSYSQEQRICVVTAEEAAVAEREVFQEQSNSVVEVDVVASVSDREAE